jgi:hypothetical protein
VSEEAPLYGEVDRAAEKLFDLAGDIGQRIVAVMCSEDLYKTIPVFKTFVAAVTAIRSVQGAILIRKLEAFVEPMSEISAAERREIIERLESDPKYQRKVGEHIIELLDRQESHRKPRISGEIFAALARRQIDHTMFHRLLNATERLPVMEIDTVRRFENSSNNLPERDTIDQESIQALVNAGLALSVGISPIGGRRTSIANATCQKFVELDLDVKSKGEQAMRA